MNKVLQFQPLKYRTLWLSDIHLGYKGCKADYLLNFLNTVECEQLYLVGDIIDFWSLQRITFWNKNHTQVIQAILHKAQQGTRVIYVPGNHDEALRDYPEFSYKNIRIKKECIHTTNDGRRLLVLHGDEFDATIQCNRLAAFLGHYGYDLLLYLNRKIHFIRRLFGLQYWSLASFLKKCVKNAMQHIDNYEAAAAHEARRRNLNGVICGHIHHANMRTLDGTLYCNTGDWVENCTALAEHSDGMLELLHWSEMRRSLKTLPPGGNEMPPVQAA